MGSHRSITDSATLLAEIGLYTSSVCNDYKVNGEWVRSIRHEGKTYSSRSYAVWNGIRSRSTVGGSFQTTFPHYVGTTICDEWNTSFDTFADWYTTQVGYKEGWDVDKDVLSGNKHYSPDTCLLLPRVVNLLFSAHQNRPTMTVATKKDGVPRWRLSTKEFALDWDEGIQRNKEIKLEYIDNLRKTYTNIRPLVFDKAEAIVAGWK